MAEYVKWPPGPRTRERSVFETADGVITCTTYFPPIYGGGVYRSWTESPFHTWSKNIEEYIEDVVTANYKQIVAQGGILPNNPLYVTKTTEQHQLMSLFWDDKQFWRTVRSGKWPVASQLGYAYVGNFLASQLVSLREQAIADAYSKVSSSGMNILVTCAELTETRKMLMDGLKYIRNFSKNCYRLWDYWKASTSKSKTSRDALLKFEELWMSMRMGFLPFAAEVGQIKDCLTGVRKYAERQTFRSARSLSATNTDSFKYVTAGFPFTYDVHTFTMKNYIVKVGIVASQRFGGVPDVWGLSKLPEAIWELTPCSWVFDYFFNIGDVISSWWPDPLWKVDRSWVIIIDKTNEMVTCMNGVPNDGHSSGSFSGGRKFREYKIIDRKPEALRPKWPTLAPNLYFARYIDTAAVVRQQANKALKKASKIAFPKPPRRNRRS